MTEMIVFGKAKWTHVQLREAALHSSQQHRVFARALN